MITIGQTFQEAMDGLDITDGPVSYYLECHKILDDLVGTHVLGCRYAVDIRRVSRWAILGTSLSFRVYCIEDNPEWMVQVNCFPDTKQNSYRSIVLPSDDHKLYDAEKTHIASNMTAWLNQPCLK